MIIGKREKTKTSGKRYEEICQRLGFEARLNFVQVLPGGAISFTAGEPDEIRVLAAAVEREEMKMAKSLRRALRIVESARARC